MKKIKEYSLYLVISEEYAMGRSALEAAKGAIVGGVDIIQMREKRKAREELLSLGISLSRLCRDSGVTFIVNDDPNMAKEVGADGVHLGQEDMARYGIDAVRDILGEGRIIGLSTHSVEQFMAANDSGVDYIAYGPVFSTKTKDYFIGTRDVARVSREAKKPVFFIGGIDLANIGVLLSQGVRNVALIRGILEVGDVAARTAEYKARLRMAEEGQRLLVRVNGCDETVPAGASISGLIQARGLSPERVVVEYNLRIVPREDWARVELKKNDSIEILNFMGGG